jgi:hypothetical protein
MTETILNKLFSGSATPEELLGRIRYAAAFQQLCKCSDSELTAELGIAADTLAAWKLRPEWDDAVQAIRRKMYFMSSKLRLFIKEMAEIGPRDVQREAVEVVVDMAFPPARHLEIHTKP